MTVVVVGDPINGVAIWGPFKSDEDLGDWLSLRASNYIWWILDYTWWVVDLEEVEK